MPSTDAKTANSKKRKAAEVAEEPQTTTKRVAKKKKKTKAKDNEADEDLDLEAGLNKAFSHMDNQLLADYLAQKTRRFESDLSAVELQDRYIPANRIRDTTSWDKPRNLENLPAFLEKFSQDPKALKSPSSKSKGAPHTIVVTGAGIRAADLARSLRKLDPKVAKLFAKHIKISESIAFLKENKVGLAVGTPARLIDLIEDGALVLDDLKSLVVDASHIDIKKQGILEMKDTQIPLIRLLSKSEIRDRLGEPEKGIDLMFY